MAKLSPDHIFHTHHSRPNDLVRIRPRKGKCCIQIVKLGVSFDGKIILDDINLHLHTGELTTLVGPNGAGKSTLFKAILGEIKHTGILHHSHAGSRVSTRPAMGYVPQHLAFDRQAPLTVLDVFCAALSKRPLFLGASRKLRKITRLALKKTQAETLIEKRMGDLSGGELQRVLLALALTPMPELLLLDEPVSGVDATGTRQFFELVRKLSREHDLSVLLISHDLQSISSYSDRVILLNKQIIAELPGSELFKHAQLLHETGLEGVRK